MIRKIMMPNYSKKINEIKGKGLKTAGYLLVLISGECQ